MVSRGYLQSSTRSHRRMTTGRDSRGRWPATSRSATSGPASSAWWAIRPGSCRWLISRGGTAMNLIVLSRFGLRHVMFLLMLGVGSSAARAACPALADAGDTAQFLDCYWQRPLAPQGTAPSQFTPLETALDPASCGACHVQQFRDWSGARHANAMGPGVLGQLLNMDAQARDEQQTCVRCHAPLAEQADSLATALASRNADAGTGLHTHGGRQARAAFADSRFCASCHQFDADGYALNGKLLENTYMEWKASPYAGEGRPCQSCHMPDRRHLWRGIHDPQMVRSGVSIGMVPPRIERGIVHAALTVRNTGTGHNFPTYVTPRVLIEIMQEDGGGHVIEGTRREYVIARQVPLDLSREIADTRLAPGAQALLDYALPRRRGATTLLYRVTVEPDAYYTGFYRSLIAAGAGRGEAMIRRALAESIASRYTLFEERRVIDPATR